MTTKKRRTDDQICLSLARTSELRSRIIEDAKSAEVSEQRMITLLLCEYYGLRMRLPKRGRPSTAKGR